MRWFESSYPSHEKPKEISLFSGIFLWFFLFQKIKVQLCFGFVSTLYVVKNVVKKETASKTTEKNLFRHFSQNEQRASFSKMRFCVTVAQGGKIMSAEKQFPKVIYQTRNEKDLTQAEVAENVDISTRWYQVIESGRKLPSAKTALKIMAFLEISGKDLQEK